MSGETFLHGIEVIEIDDGFRPIETQRSSVIGIVGTAPEADPAKFPYNTPVLIAGSRREAAFLGTLGTLPSAMDAIFDQTGALVAVIRVPSTGTETETLTRGVAPADMTETLTQAAVYVSKVYDETKVYVKGTDYTVNGNTITWINKATATRPANAASYSVDFEVALTAAQVKSNIIGGVDTATGQYKGLQALLAAQSVAKVSPRILVIPEFSQYLEVASELIGIAERLKAVMIVDGPSTNDADAISYRENFGSPRVYIIDPRVKKWDTAANDYRFLPASPCVAGLISKTDNEKGFWWSPSNQVINGIVGTERAIDHYIDDPNCRANYLNENEVATIVQADGFRLWGNRTASADIKWAFLNVRRTADMVNQSILHAHRWAIDRNITKTLVEDVLEGVNAYIRHLKKVGAIINGKAWADPELNTPDQVMQGKLYIDFEFTPNYPCEHLIFRSHLVDDYLVEIFARAA